MINIWHLEVTTKNGENETTEHSYYTGRDGLWYDNRDVLGVSKSTLDKNKEWPYSRTSHYFDWTIRKGTASTTSEVKAYYEALDNLTPPDEEE